MSDSSTDKLTKTVLHTALHVAHELLHQGAVLLPHVFQVFLHKCGHSTLGTEEEILEGSEGTIKFSSCWLLKQLIIYLCNHMDYKCVHKRFGTVLFRKGGDMLVSLSWALRRADNNSGLESKSLYKFKTRKSNDTVVSSVLTEAGNIINDLIHKEISKLSYGG